MRGVWVAPWDPSEIYAVAADWAQASCPVYVLSGDGEWVLESHGRQVADFRHNCRAALRSELEESIRMSGDEVDDDEVDGYLDDAEDLLD